MLFEMCIIPRVTKRAKYESESTSNLSYNSSDETDDDLNDSKYTKQETFKNEDGVRPLECLDPSLYGQKMDDKFVQ